MPQRLRTSFRNLQELRLNHTWMPWPEIKKLIFEMPSLRVLEIGSNRLERLYDTGLEDEAKGSILEVLNFDENGLQDWCDTMVSISGFSLSGISSFITLICF
jgi:hypothetical protein